MVTHPDAPDPRPGRTAPDVGSGPATGVPALLLDDASIGSARLDRVDSPPLVLAGVRAGAASRGPGGRGTAGPGVRPVRVRSGGGPSRTAAGPFPTAGAPVGA